MATALEELRNNTPAKQEAPKDFPAMLQQWLPEIKRALPQHLNGDRMARIALTAFRRTPKLGRCNPMSVFSAVIQASQLGLEPDTLGRAYLIPYEKREKVGNRWQTVDVECQFVPGWKGLVDLMNRSGMGTVWTGVIFRDQKYRFVDGSTRELQVLNETELDEPSDITHAYAIGWIKGQAMPIMELWRTEKIRKHRDRYNKVGDRHYSFEHWEMYARKVVLLQVLKYMPCSAELAAAIALNDAAEIGAQHIDLQDAIDGTWTPAADDVGTDQQPDPSSKRSISGEQQSQQSQSQPAGPEGDAPDIDDLTAMVRKGQIEDARALCPAGLYDQLEAIIQSVENNRRQGSTSRRNTFE